MIIFIWLFKGLVFFSRAESLRDDKFEPVEQTGGLPSYFYYFSIFFQHSLSLSSSISSAVFFFYFFFYVRLFPCFFFCPLDFKDTITIYRAVLVGSRRCLWSVYNPLALNRGYPAAGFLYLFIFSFFLALLVYIYKCP